MGPSWDGSDERVTVVRMEHHPDRTLDAAVLWLEAPLSVHPATLGVGTPSGSLVRIVGFGARRRGRFLDGGGQRVSRSVRPLDVACNGRRSSTSGCRPGREWLIAAQLGIDTCTGDSGGAVFLRSPEGEHLVALVSRGVLNGRRLCGDGGIYVRVDAVLDWLDPWLEAR